MSHKDGQRCLFLLQTLRYLMSEGLKCCMEHTVAVPPGIWTLSWLISRQLLNPTGSSNSLTDILKFNNPKNDQIYGTFLYHKNVLKVFTLLKLWRLVWTFPQLCVLDQQVMREEGILGKKKTWNCELVPSALLIMTMQFLDKIRT